MLLFAWCVLHFSFSATAQNFLWGRSGGSSDPSQGADDETVTDIATDRNGNVYILAPSLTAGRNVAGNPLPSYGYCDIVLSSFRPDGTFRWAKVIGGSDDDLPKGLQTDAKDGVYICAAVSSNSSPGHIDADATLAQNYQFFLLVKYDTAGNYQWHRQPEASTLPDGNSWNYTRSVAMDVDDAGNVYWLMSLYDGVYEGSLTVPALGLYILKYDAGGNFSYIKPDIEADMQAFPNMNMKIDDVDGRFYLSGYRSGGTITMGGNVITNSMYIGCFNLDGTFNWKRENSRIGSGFSGRAVIDASSNIYLCGASNATLNGVPNDNFNGYEVTHGGGSGTPFIIKMDKNGTNIWGADAVVNAASGATGIALRNNEVVMSGVFPRLLEWPGYSGTGYNKPVNEGYDMFITRFDAGNGAVLGIDKVGSTFGYNEFSTCMASDGRGNVYIGGEFAADMNVNSLYNLTSTGGQTDWFVIKYGDMWPANVNVFVSDKDVIIYPNPAYDKVNISNAGVGTTLQLSDMAGRVLQTQLLHSNQEKIDVSAYPTGSYIIRLIDKNGGNVIRKIVKG